jgi:hypothetical protein
MKKFQLIVSMLILSMTFISCGDDDSEDSSAPVSDIVGSWDVTSTDLSFDLNGMDLVQYFVSELGLSQAEAVILQTGFDSEFGTFDQVIFTFNADGTYVVTNPAEGNENGTYTLNSNETQITMTSGGESYVVDISTLTASRLVMTINEVDNSQDLDDDGTNDTLAVTFELELSKI